MQPDFAAIRPINDRQVLAWVENTHDDICLHIQFQFSGACADMKLGFGDAEDMGKAESEEAKAKAYAALARFNAGELDEMISKQIASTEADFPVEEETNE